MHLNVRTAVIAAKALVPAMRKQGGGRIVMNTSRVTLGKISRTLYSASKGAMQAMARTWALELARDGITVNCVAPGPIATSVFWKNNPPDSDETRNLICLRSSRSDGHAGRRRQRRQLLLRREGELRYRANSLCLRRRHGRVTLTRSDLKESPGRFHCGAGVDADRSISYRQTRGLTAWEWNRKVPSSTRTRSPSPGYGKWYP